MNSNSQENVNDLKDTEWRRYSEPIYIDKLRFHPKHFIIPFHYKKYIESVLLPHGLIRDRIEKLAQEIHDVFQNNELHLLCLLKGSRAFFSLLLFYLNKMNIYSQVKCSKPPYMEHYVRVKSYINDTPNSDGKLSIISEDLDCLKGKDILIVEDIIDTGNTLEKFCAWLEKLNPRRVLIASLLEKRTPKTNGIKANFAGFSVPDEFLIGFSLDYNEVFRDLDHICIMNTQALSDFAV
uniref:Hypoxanthine phosphoribosyltransferase n=1 Tax=Nephromyces sp. MMRI TaxID=2496275 RepID=A0A3S5HLW7_9APIC|nr:hypoxanthine-guanine phosphoribosyltransferase [Nephromyces sp. MMRI]AZL94654.1 hypoxanthine-guanine phosphoribosyltransferase [Nephromyces sp. MMRI]AZL94655.1 hypoxanthine-guanine phosphoribosyltransferase [Nephromyces sp. MMRI]AZL94656.1 hypoxanthine-guanine phosphoribosyltransferase [Nephromyces sp. MMRI]AZL94657.1 hypoxanthine-guanine phosphoribosyltransferase [Nephromyces sp. MMRI]